MIDKNKLMVNFPYVRQRYVKQMKHHKDIYNHVAPFEVPDDVWGFMCTCSHTLIKIQINRRSPRRRRRDATDSPGFGRRCGFQGDVGVRAQALPVIFYEIRYISLFFWSNREPFFYCIYFYNHCNCPSCHSVAIKQYI